MDIPFYETSLSVLVKFTLYVSHYNGADMVEYRLMNLEIANIIKKYIETFGQTEYLTFYCGLDAECLLENVQMEIFLDDDIINAFQLLKIKSIIKSTYYIYDI